MKKAIVTLTIGAEYERLFDVYCRFNWEKYCDKYGYDLIIINNPLDNSLRAAKRSPAWQKLLILSQEWSANYEIIVWIDADVLINTKHSDDICLKVPVEKVGAVETYSIPTKELYNISLTRIYHYYDENNIKYINNLLPQSYYTNRGIAGNNLSEVVQTGVFVSSPRYHREIFEHIYYKYEDTKGAEWNYEMPAMSYELIKSGMVHWISPRFNFCVMDIIAAFYPELLFQKNNNSHIWMKILKKYLPLKSADHESDCLNNIFDLSVFMHFAGCPELIPKVKYHDHR